MIFKVKDLFKKYFNPEYFIYVVKNKKWKILKTIILVWLLSIIITFVLHKIYHGLILKKTFWNKDWLIIARKENNWKDLPPPVDQNLPIPKGFVGGCEGFGQRPGDPLFDNLPMKGNHENDDRGQRMMRAWWPEFNWREFPQDLTNTDMVYERVNQDISRLLYTDDGEILSLICPQRGKCIKSFGCVKVEVTVSKVKGWVDEKNKQSHGSFEGYLTIWVDKYDIEREEHLMKLFLDNYPDKSDLPTSKANGIIVPYGRTDKEGSNTTHTEFRDNNNISPKLHNEAYMVISLSAFVGKPNKTDDRKIDLVNQFLIDLSTVYTNNMFLPGQLLTWDLYLIKPEVVDKEEYMKHVEEMRVSYQLCDESCGTGWDGPTINEYGEEAIIREELIEDIVIEFKKL